MTMIRAHFDGKTIVPDEAVDLPVNQPLAIHVDLLTIPATQETQADVDGLFAEMRKLAIKAEHPIDYSRDSVYSGTVDDTR